MSSSKQSQEEKPFRFKQFTIFQDKCAMKVNTDAILLGAWADVDNAEMVLDIGAGTGVIAIMLAQRNQNAWVHAAEIDAESYTQSHENMLRSPWANRLSVFHTPIQDYARVAEEKYDLIVSNPPFFSGGTLSSNHNKTSVRHTVKLPHGDLLIAVRNMLNEDGRFCLILPYLEGLRFCERAASYKLFCTQQLEVIPKEGRPVERLLLQFERTRKECKTEQIILQNDSENGYDYTEAYRKLAGDFLLVF